MRTAWGTPRCTYATGDRSTYHLLLVVDAIEIGRKKFCAAIHQAHTDQKSKVIGAPKLGKKESRGKADHFLVKHFAGDVTYSVVGWLEKNNDKLSDDYEKMFASSSKALIVGEPSDEAVSEHLAAEPPSGLAIAVANVYGAPVSPFLMIGNTDTRHYWEVSENIFSFIAHRRILTTLSFNSTNSEINSCSFQK